MGWSEAHKSKTRNKILDSAAALFMERGFDQVGINDVMKLAGMTRGAFYHHFSSKGELYRESLVRASQSTTDFIQQRSGQCADKMIDIYVGSAHRAGEGLRCPLAFLVTDIHHQDEDVRQTYTMIFKRFLALLQADSTGDAQSNAIQQAVMMVGAIAISRALSDDELAEDILSVCREAVKTYQSVN